MIQARAKMFARFAATLLAVALLASPAFAEEATARAKPAVAKRRAQKLSQERQGEKVLRVGTIVVAGRPQLPQTSFVVAVQPFRFPVGTAQYSAR